MSIDYAATFTSIVTEATKGITEVLPIVVPILGAMAAITLGLRIFRKLTGRA
ncbi:MAG: hypothetical protein ACOY4I_05290 [Bacillota bacterium]